MKQLSDSDWKNIDTAGQINEIIARLTEEHELGDYRFEARYPAEHTEYRRIASEFRTSAIPELSRVGFRMSRVLLELVETDKTFAKYVSGKPVPRQGRKQVDLLTRAFQNLVEACESLSQPEIKI